MAQSTGETTGQHQDTIQQSRHLLPQEMRATAVLGTHRVQERSVICNYNLVHDSSTPEPGSWVVKKKEQAKGTAFGDPHGYRSCAERRSRQCCARSWQNPIPRISNGCGNKRIN